MKLLHVLLSCGIVILTAKTDKTKESTVAISRFEDKNIPNAETMSLGDRVAYLNKHFAGRRRIRMHMAWFNVIRFDADEMNDRIFIVIEASSGHRANFTLHQLRRDTPMM